MNFEILKMIVLNTSAAILPVLIGALILLGAVSLSPLGRNWIGYLRERRRDSEALEAMLAEIGGLRTVLTEVIERLDATERRLAAGPLPPPMEGRTGSDRIATPV
jgi:hypothetical protein